MKGDMAARIAFDGVNHGVVSYCLAACNRVHAPVSAMVLTNTVKQRHTTRGFIMGQACSDGRGVGFTGETTTSEVKQNSLCSIYLQGAETSYILGGCTFPV